jgi:hypothetical protein
MIARKNRSADEQDPNRAARRAAPRHAISGRRLYALSKPERLRNADAQ